MDEATRPLRQRVKDALRGVVSPAWRKWLRDRMKGEAYTPPPGWVRMGALRRVTPVSRDFGFARGEPIDRYYIESFLAEQAADVRARVLEIGDAAYTRTFGGDRVTMSDVLHATDGNPDATIVGDLASGENVPEGAFDCIILTQTLQMIYDVRAAVRNIHRALAPGGVVLATVPGISQVSRFDMDRWGDFWRFTSRSVQRLFDEAFGESGNVSVRAYGNALTATAFLHGLAQQDLRRRELEHQEPDYELIVAVRAVKPAQGGSIA